MMKLFLSLDDAVSVAVKEFGINSVRARNEFMQKCRVPAVDYQNGYEDGLKEAEKMIRIARESECTSK